MGEHFPTPPSPALPALQLPQSRCRSFPALLQLALVSLSSRIKPLLEMCLEALEHLFFYVFDVGEPVSTSDIAVFTGTLKLQNEFFHWRPLVPVFFRPLKDYRLTIFFFNHDRLILSLIHI